MNRTSCLLPLVLLSLVGCAADRGDDTAVGTSADDLGVNGRLDTSFGTDGTAPVSFGEPGQPGASTSVSALLANDDGTFYAAGVHGRGAYGDPIVDQLVLAKYTKDGKLDTAFAS